MFLLRLMSSIGNLPAADTPSKRSWAGICLWITTTSLSFLLIWQGSKRRFVVVCGVLFLIRKPVCSSAMITGRLVSRKGRWEAKTRKIVTLKFESMIGMIQKCPVPWLSIMKDRLNLGKFAPNGGQMESWYDSFFPDRKSDLRATSTTTSE